MQYLGNKIILVSMQSGKLSGCLMEKISKGIAVVEIGEELDKLNTLTNVVSLLEEGALLQIYQDGFNICSEIGYVHNEGPYGEEQYFEVHYSAKDESVLSSLDRLNNLTTKKEKSTDKEYKKVYRTYGQVGYRS